VCSYEDVLFVLPTAESPHAIAVQYAYNNWYQNSLFIFLPIVLLVSCAITQWVRQMIIGSLASARKSFDASHDSEASILGETFPRCSSTPVTLNRREFTRSVRTILGPGYSKEQTCFSVDIVVQHFCLPVRWPFSSGRFRRRGYRTVLFQKQMQQWNSMNG